MRREPTVTIRCGGAVEVLDLVDFAPTALLAADPYRSIRWYKGQPHYPGWYWFATTGEHVIYESRLEMLRLQLADFDTRVSHAIAQPFLLTYTDPDGRQRRHVPDYALIGPGMPLRIVNVKPAHRMADPKVANLLAWAGAELDAVGFITEIWTGETPAVIANLRLLGGHRNPRLFAPQHVRRANEAITSPCTIAAAEATFASLGISNPRPLLLHLLWRQDLLIDLTARITADSEVVLP